MTNLAMLKIIIDSIKEKNSFLKKELSIDHMADFFEASNTNKKKFNFAYLNYFLWNNLTRDSVAKRKTTSRDFEDVLATIFNGVINDNVKRENLNKDDFFLENKIITGSAVGNKREKADIDFPENYSVSVKTLMLANTEINFGSFEKVTLFGGLNVEHYLTERKGTGKEKIGLGSRPRLLNLLLEIKKNGDYPVFRNRFNKLIEFVFSDDLVVLVKNSDKMDLYFIDGNDFVELLKVKSKTPEDLVSIVNRWEGNSIRMNRVEILNLGRKVSFDFSFLDEHIITKILNTEEIISKYFFCYMNKYPDNKRYRSLIVKQCNLLLDEIDGEINELI